MLSRFISKPSHHLRFFSLLISSQSHPKLPQYHHHSPSNPNFSSFNILPKYFSTNNDNGDGHWKLTPEIEDSGGLGGIFDAEVSKEDDNDGDDLFKTDTVPEAAGINEDWTNVKDADDDNGDGDLFKGIDQSVKEVGRDGDEDEDWTNVKDDDDNEDGDLFKGIDQSVKEVGRDGNEDWVTADGYEPWDLATEGKEVEDVFDIGQSEMTGFPDGELVDLESEKIKEEKVQLQKEEKELAAVLKGPNRAFGDLVATSGITEEMLESLIALKDLEGIQGLPPLSEIEDMRYEKNTKKSTRADIERQKQEEVANARVRKIDSKGRAYATGKRKCSIARVWIQPGDGKFVVNEKQFDVYFPVLEQRAALLRPFTETKTLGYWDVHCTVKGGGFSGQVGAIRLGISKALQNWAPSLRPPLKEAGFLTRDSRIVERKKPGKAKARKSFQWVKR